MTTPDPYTSSGLPHGVPPVSYQAPPGLGGAHPPALPCPETPTQLPPEMTQMHVPSTPQLQIPPVQLQYPAPIYAAPLPQPAPAKTNTMATTSLILGLFAMFCVGPLTGIPAIITGFLARKQITSSGGTQTGAGQAITGIVLGIVATAATVFGLLLWLLIIVLAAGAGEPPLY